MFKKMVMFAAALASRGVSSKKIDEQTKQLRVLSCFGHGDIPQCPTFFSAKTRKTIIVVNVAVVTAKELGS
jgi:hypothetical protein